MTIYCDTTFFIGLYVAIDTHSAAALTEWRRLDCPPLVFTPLHRLEVRNAIRQFEFTGDLKPAKTKEVLRCLDEDLADGTLVHQRRTLGRSADSQHGCPRNGPVPHRRSFGTARRAIPYFRRPSTRDRQGGRLQGCTAKEFPMIEPCRHDKTTNLDEVDSMKG